MLLQDCQDESLPSASLRVDLIHKNGSSLARRQQELMSFWDRVVACLSLDRLPYQAGKYCPLWQPEWLGSGSGSLTAPPSNNEVGTWKHRFAPAPFLTETKSMNKTGQPVRRKPGVPCLGAVICRQQCRLPPAR